jgi:hypothetical protein
MSRAKLDNFTLGQGRGPLMHLDSDGNPTKKGQEKTDMGQE